MEFDYSLLIERIKVMYKSLYTFADLANLEVTGLYRKLNNKRRFTQDEIIVFQKLLEIPDEDVKKYFLTEKGATKWKKQR